MDRHLLWDSIHRFKAVAIPLFSHSDSFCCNRAWTFQEKKTTSKGRPRFLSWFFVLWRHVWLSKGHKLLLYKLRNKAQSDLMPKLRIKTEESRILSREGSVCRMHYPKDIKNLYQLGCIDLAIYKTLASING